MNEHARNTGFLLQLPVVLALVGFNPVAEAQVDNFTVALQVNAAQTELDVTSRGRCSNNNHNGCLDIPKHKTAKIKFPLNGNRQCNRSGGGMWNLDEVYLGGKGSLSKPTTWGTLDTEVQLDFDVADAATGLLNKASGSSDQKIVITDDNKYAYDIWDKVTAICVDEGGSTIATIETDPRIKNGGTQ